MTIRNLVIEPIHPTIEVTQVATEAAAPGTKPTLPT